MYPRQPLPWDPSMRTYLKPVSSTVAQYPPLSASESAFLPPQTNAMSLSARDFVHPRLSLDTWCKPDSTPSTAHLRAVARLLEEAGVGTRGVHLSPDSSVVTCSVLDSFHRTHTLVMHFDTLHACSFTHPVHPHPPPHLTHFLIDLRIISTGTIS